MPSGQQYATNVPQTTLVSGLTNVATTFGVSSSTNWPATPFTAVIDLAQSNQEPIDVINVSGVNWTVVRAVDNTTAFSHAANAPITHADIGRDFRESRSHLDASSSPDVTGYPVHGLANGSSVVGTTDAQILSNKTIAAGTYTGNQAMGSGNWTGTGIAQESAFSVAGLTGATAGTRLVGAVAGGSPASGTFSTGDVVVDTTYHMQWLCTSGGTPGTWVPMSSKILLATNTPTTGSTTFSTIPAVPSFNHLRIEYVARNSGTSAGGLSTITAMINSDAGTNYSHQYSLIPSGASTPTIATASGNANMTVGVISNTSGGSGAVGRGYIDVPFYKETAFAKVLNFQSGAGQSGTAGNVEGSGEWTSAAAISNILISTAGGSFVSGSTFNLYALI